MGGAAACSEGFVACFLKVPLACLGSMAAALQPNSLGTLRRYFTKPSLQPDAPDCSVECSFCLPRVPAAGLDLTLSVSQ